MKTFILTIISFLLVFYSVLADVGITYEICGGRLGDQLIHYCYAKMLSVEHAIPFFYKPFEFSSKLCLSRDQKYNESLFLNYERILVGNQLRFKCSESKNILYIATSSLQRIAALKDHAWFGINHSKEFRIMVRDLIKPRTPIALPELPSDQVTVAVHVRTGEGYDIVDRNDVTHQTQFPPQPFYLSQIKKIIGLFPEQRIYFYIFTDALDPEAIVNNYKTIFAEYTLVTFDTRKQKSSWQSHVLYDLFFMAEFDCLIRARSAFSIIAQLIGNHMFVLYPGGEIIS